MIRSIRMDEIVKTLPFKCDQLFYQSKHKNDHSPKYIQIHPNALLAIDMIDNIVRIMDKFSK